MGGAKALIAEREDQQNWANGLLLEHDVISECENHGYLTDNLGGGIEEAVADARETPYEGLTPDEAEEVVRNALDQIGDECPGCNSNRDD